jgi:hypothetical protein
MKSSKQDSLAYLPNSNPNSKLYSAAFFCLNKSLELTVTCFREDEVPTSPCVCSLSAANGKHVRLYQMNNFRAPVFGCPNEIFRTVTFGIVECIVHNSTNFSQLFFFLKTNASDSEGKNQPNQAGVWLHDRERALCYGAMDVAAPPHCLQAVGSKASEVSLPSDADLDEPITPAR